MRKAECKFCHKSVLFNNANRRYYDEDGKTLHVDSCELRKAHFKNSAAEGAETRRSSRN